MRRMDAHQEENVALAFSRQSPVFDAIDEENKLLGWMRDRIRREVLRYAKRGDYMLELNCGTGMDALFFAGKGIRVMATDNAPGMLQQVQKKVTAVKLEDRITTHCCSFNNLTLPGGHQQFNYVFSNFGGLNCTDDLAGVLKNIDLLLKPGGYCTLVIMPKVCLWEMSLIFKGYFKTAFRRWKRGGTIAQVEGVPFKCYYYSPQYIIKHAGPGYESVSLKGLAIAVPPPYIEHFTERHPRLFKKLEHWENKLWNRPPFNRWGDHFIITLQKKALNE